MLLSARCAAISLIIKCIKMDNDNNKKISLSLLLLLLTIAQSGCTYFQPEPQLSYSKDKVKEIDHVVKTIYNNGQFSGIVLVSVKEM